MSPGVVGLQHALTSLFHIDLSRAVYPKTERRNLRFDGAAPTVYEKDTMMPLCMGRV
jgi:hypothetical protein